MCYRTGTAENVFWEVEYVTRSDIRTAWKTLITKNVLNSLTISTSYNIYGLCTRTYSCASTKVIHCNTSMYLFVWRLWPFRAKEFESDYVTCLYYTLLGIRSTELVQNSHILMRRSQWLTPTKWLFCNFFLCCQLLGLLTVYLLCFVL